ncbi:DEAD/DEAH box helicase [Variovorax sp. ZS18.2.2]|uniref:DEAD/DEAH box helicase n=1 Tax=Variovorax sp. ZS18.2.2 TaxID=2971255 RepID=UPI0021513486|nr:DEAD/DEAH box helicase [Variovorax sp. ZS18.2.2]MCR6480956.1 DEAD/DEAH box helicase [Variovorax sp. ZS18.2.2]
MEASCARVIDVDVDVGVNVDAPQSRIMTALPPPPVLLQPVSLRPPELLVKAVADGYRCGLQVINVPDAKRPLATEGGWWFGPRRMWVLPAGQPSMVQACIARAYAGQFVDLEDVPGMLRAAMAPAALEADFFTQLLDVQIFPLARGELQRGRFAVSFQFDTLCVSAMRAMGGYFHKHAAAWQVQGEPEAIMARLREVAGIAPEYVFVHEQPVVLENLTGATSSASPIQVPAAPPPSVSGETKDEGTGFFSTDLDREEDLAFDRPALARLVEDGTLRDYQATGVAHLLRQSGACLGDDMGLGKSRQVVVGTRTMADEIRALMGSSGRVLIVCPASLRINWEREIRLIYPQATVGFVGEDRMSTLHACQWVIGNYERLGGLVREPQLAFDVMAVDEAHYLKEYDSGRTRNVFLLGARIPRRYVVTGTPLLNREIEMHTLLRITGHHLGQMELSEFRKTFSGSSEKRALLAAALKGWMLRRSKSVLKDLGQKHRQERYISPAEGLGAYNEILQDMSLMAMPKITKLRRALEALKTPFIVETVESLSEGDKIIVFCEYMATVETLKSAFAAMGVGCVSLVGADSAAKRQKAIDSFQNDASATVFIGTTSAAGVGITLTAANYVIFASLPWTPALMRQAEDRAYRLGQKRDVFVIVPLVPKTIDDGVWQLLANKRTTEEEVVDAVKSSMLG